MVRIERLLPKNVLKLGSPGSRPFKVLRQFGTNAYELELPKKYGVNPMFNVADLVLYKGPVVVLSENLEHIPTYLSDPTNKIPPSAQKH